MTFSSERNSTRSYADCRIQAQFADGSDGAATPKRGPVVFRSTLVYGMTYDMPSTYRGIPGKGTDSTSFTATSLYVIPIRAMTLNDMSVFTAACTARMIAGRRSSVRTSFV